jgi:hypothetical protein
MCNKFQSLEHGIYVRSHVRIVRVGHSILTAFHTSSTLGSALYLMRSLGHLAGARKAIMILGGYLVIGIAIALDPR